MKTLNNQVYMTIDDITTVINQNSPEHPTTWYMVYQQLDTMLSMTVDQWNECGIHQYDITIGMTHTAMDELDSVDLDNMFTLKRNIVLINEDDSCEDNVYLHMTNDGEFAIALDWITLITFTRFLVHQRLIDHTTRFDIENTCLPLDVTILEPTCYDAGSNLSREIIN